MSYNPIPIVGAALALGLFTSGVHAQQPHSAQQQEQRPDAVAEILDQDGTTVGTAELIETAEQGVLIRARFDGLPAGTHGFHIHERGTCTPSFDAAGDHYAPRDQAHGVFHEEGRHAGDLLNVEVPEDGAITVERLAPDVTLSSGNANLLDDDGTALVVHAEADDYVSQPSGDSGDRIACGVIVPS